MGKVLESLSFFAGVSVIATTIITIVLCTAYAKRQLPPSDGTETNPEFLGNWWYIGLFGTELYTQAMFEKYLDFVDALINIVGNVIGNAILFFICYGVLTAAGVDKDNKYERARKATMGLIIVSFALLFLADYGIRNGF